MRSINVEELNIGKQVWFRTDKNSVNKGVIIFVTDEHAVLAVNIIGEQPINYFLAAQAYTKELYETKEDLLAANYDMFSSLGDFTSKTKANEYCRDVNTFYDLAELCIQHKAMEKAISKRSKELLGKEITSFPITS